MLPPPFPLDLVEGRVLPGRCLPSRRLWHRGARCRAAAGPPPPLPPDLAEGRAPPWWMEEEERSAATMVDGGGEEEEEMERKREEEERRKWTAARVGAHVLEKGPRQVAYTHVLHDRGLTIDYSHSSYTCPPRGNLNPPSGKP
uniref:Uncharacterized protein n=1 Tax=Oryza meridionalis TaxID=40149 RepID=A0A0E0F8Z8_9ORYZ